MHLWFWALTTLPAMPSFEQSQSCPININFSTGTLTHWQAYTGNNKDGNGPDAIKLVYDSNASTPFGTIGAATLPEYNLPGVSGVRVITTQATDPFGRFPMIPTINGYAYHYAILLGSTSVSRRQPNGPNDQPGTGTPANNGPLGGYIRGISYQINVPPGPSTLPYTMTYAYAMVLENGTHASLDQPMARAIGNGPGQWILPKLNAYPQSCTQSPGQRTIPAGRLDKRLDGSDIRSDPLSRATGIANLRSGQLRTGWSFRLCLLRPQRCLRRIANERRYPCLRQQRREVFDPIAGQRILCLVGPRRLDHQPRQQRKRHRRHHRTAARMDRRPSAE